MDLEFALTTVLGLKKQGSDEQKALIEKYFPDYKAAKLILRPDCHLAPSSASALSNFASLSFVVSGDSIWVNYQLNVYERGNLKVIKGQDLHVFSNPVNKNKNGYCSRGTIIRLKMGINGVSFNSSHAGHGNLFVTDF